MWEYFFFQVNFTIVSFSRVEDYTVSEVFENKANQSSKCCMNEGGPVLTYEFVLLSLLTTNKNCFVNKLQIRMSSHRMSARCSSDELLV